MLHTYQIAETVLNDYVTAKLTQERLNMLITQANEQLEEFAQEIELFERAKVQAGVPDGVDNIILWIALMSNEDICCDYIDTFGKKYREIIPVSDIADLITYVVYLKRIKEEDLQGIDFLLHNDTAGVGEADQYGFMNVLLFVQKGKEGALEF